MLESILGVIAGTILGIITGLLPGIHINSILVVLTGFSGTDTLFATTAVVSMSITNQFVSFIPSVFLGVPGENNFLSVLPGHYFTKKGLGLYAVRLAIIGGVSAFLFTIIFLVVIGKFIENTPEFFSSMTPFALSAILAAMVVREKTMQKKFFALIVISLSALSGVLLLNASTIKNNLFILVTGFFAMPTLIGAVNEKTNIPKQSGKPLRIKIENVAKTGFLGTAASVLATIFPAVGPSEMIFVTGEFSGKTTKQKYLMLNGGVQTASFLLSFAALFFIGKARTGAAAFISQTTSLSPELFYTIIAACIASCGIAAIATDLLATRAAKNIHKINYGAVNKAILFSLALLVFFLDGAFGIIALATTTCIGLLASSTGIRRTTCMAFLIVPTIIFYAGL